jgi:hypothetical protein
MLRTTLIVLSIVLPATIFAQMAGWFIPRQDIGGPEEPPFITFLGIANTGKMATDHSLLPPGPVKEVIFEELRVEASPGGQVDDVLEYSRRDYDDGGRVVHEFSGARGPGAETTYTYDGAHLVSMESATTMAS